MPYYGPRGSLPKQYDPTGAIVQAFQRIEEKPMREAEEEYLEARTAIAQRKGMGYGVMPPGYEPPGGEGGAEGGESPQAARRGPRPADIERPPPSARRGQPSAMDVDPESFNPVHAGTEGPVSSFGGALDNAAAQATGETAATQTPGRSSAGAGRVPPEERGLPPGDVRAPMGTDPEQYAEQVAGTFAGGGGQGRSPVASRRGRRSGRSADTIMPTEHDMGTIRRDEEPRGGRVSEGTVDLFGGYQYRPQGRGGRGTAPWRAVYQAFRDAGENITPSQAQTIAAEYTQPGDFGFGEQGGEDFPPFNPSDPQLRDVAPDGVNLSAYDTPGARYEAFMTWLDDQPSSDAGDLEDSPTYVRAMNHAARLVSEEGMTTSQAIEDAREEYDVTVKMGDVGLNAARAGRGRETFYGGRGRPSSQLGRSLHTAIQSGRMSAPDAIRRVNQINARRREVQDLIQQGLERDEAVNRVSERHNLSANAMEWLDEPPLDETQYSELVSYLTAPGIDPRDVYERMPFLQPPRR